MGRRVGLLRPSLYRTADFTQGCLKLLRRQDWERMIPKIFRITGHDGVYGLQSTGFRKHSILEILER